MPLIAVNGIELYYESHGTGAPLLVLGGLGLDVSEMGVLTGRWPPRFRVIAADNRGAGRSAKPPGPYSIGQITAPVLIAHGTSDHIAPVAMASQMHDLIPGSRLVLIDGGHLAPLLTRHQRLVAEVSAFLTASA